MTKPHTLFKIVISLIVLAVYGGCQVQDIDIPEDYGTTKGLREVIITAQAEDLATDTATRTETELVIGDDNKWTYPMYWLQGDKIMIYSAGEASEFTSINTERTRVAKFKGVISVITGADDGSDKDYVWGIYPSSAAVAYSEPQGKSENVVITADFPSMQQGKPGSYGDDLAMMIGRSESLGIYFKSVYSCLYFTFARNDIASITLKGLKGETLAGRIDVTLVNGVPEATPVAGYEKDNVTLFATNGAFVPGEEYYIVFLPQVFENGISLTVRKTDGYEGTYELRASNLALKRNVFTGLKTPDSRVENSSNIANGTSTGWVQSTSSLLNEIHYKTANPIPSDISVVSFNPSVYKLSDETGNELDIANCVLPEDNGGVGILRFKAPVTEIDKYAFSNTNIKEIILPDCVETIHQGAFEACQLLSDVNLGASLKSIGSYSFYGTSLSSITLPEGLERIGAFAFASTLLESITIPESVSHLGFREENPNSLAPLGNPFGNCPNLKRFKGKFSTQDGRALVENNKNGYSYFVSFATNGMDGQPYHVPEVYAVSPYAFYNATIGSVTFGGVETIFTYAFNNCGQLKSVVIPSNLTKIGGYAFGGCSALEFIEINSTQVPTAYDSQGHMFDGSSCPIYVRSNLVDAYKTTALWSDYEARYHFKQPEYAIWYKTNDGSVAPETLPDGFSRGADLPDGTKVIKYGSNITNIPNDFFINTTNLTEVFLPSEVVSIGSYAFANCQNLKNVHFGNKLTTIEMNAFQSCSSLNSIDLPESLTTLGTHVFQYCSNITTIRIPDALTSVSDNPFYFCDGLSSFTGTNNMISEDGRCLVKNGTLASFATAGLEDQIYTIPEGVTSIGAQAFTKANFNSVIIPETVRSIGWAAFYSNTHLTTIDIPSSVTSMSSWVFNGCSALYKVTLHNTTPPTLGNGVFNGTHSSLSIFVPAGSVEAYKTNSSWIAALNSVDVIQAIPTE